MGRTMQQNFERRFGNPPRITVRAVPLDEDKSEMEYRKERIFKAYSGVLRDLLGREPTPEEVFGEKPLRLGVDERNSEGFGIKDIKKERA